MNKGKAAFSEAAGAAAVYTVAVYLHFAYSLSPSALTILFGAVNESVWEHTKIFSAAFLGYSLLQLCWLKVSFKKYLVARCIGLYALMGGIIGFFYLYTAFTGRAIFQVDIISSLITVILVQALCFWLETRENRLDELFTPALLLILLYYLMFFSFTIFPPKLGLFRDPISGGYGLVSDFDIYR